MRVALTFFSEASLSEFVQYWGVFCAKLGWEGVVVLKYCTFAENYREE